MARRSLNTSQRRWIEAKRVPLVIIITNDDSRYQMLCAELPYTTEKVRMYEAYLTNFELRGA